MSAAANSIVGMPSLAAGKSLGTAFLAILATVSEEEVPADELEDASANRNTGTQSAAYAGIRNENTRLESAAGDWGGRLISPAASSDQSPASDRVSFGVQANRSEINEASPKVANARIGLALPDETNEATSAKAVVTRASSQPVAQPSQTGVVFQPIPASELTKTGSPRAVMETGMEPLPDEINALFASAAKVSGSSSQISVEINPRVNPVPVTFAHASDLEGPTPRRMKDGATPHAVEPSLAISLSGKISVSSSQPLVAIRNHANPVPVTTARESDPEVPAPRLTKSGTTARAVEPSVPASPLENVLVSPSQPSVAISRPANHVPTTFPRVSADGLPKAPFIEPGTTAHSDAPIVANSSSKNASVSSSQIPAQDTDSRQTLQRTLATVSAPESSAPGLTKTGSKSNAGEANTPKFSAKTVQIAPAQILVRTSSSRLLSQPSFAAVSEQASSGTSLKSTDMRAHADQLIVPASSANTVPIAPAQLAAQISSSPVTSQSSFADTTEKAASAANLEERGSKTNADEPTVPASSTNTLPIAPAQLAAQISSSPVTSQSSFADTTEKAASAANVAVSGSKTNADELTVPASSANEVPTAPAQLAAQIISSRVPSHLPFTDTTEKAAFATNLAEPGSKTDADELTVPASSANEVPTAPAQLAAQIISSRVLSHLPFTDTTEKAASATNLAEPGSKTHADEITVLASSANTIPIAPAQLAAQINSSRLASQSSSAAVQVQAYSARSSVEGGSKTPDDELTVPASSINAIPIAPAQFAAQIISSRLASQSSSATAQIQASSAPSSAEPGSNTHADELTVRASSMNTVPIEPPLAAQISPSRLASQSSSAAVQAQPSFAANLVGPGSKTHADEFTVTESSAAKAPAESFLAPVQSNPPRGVIQPAIAAIPDEQAPGISLIETEANTGTREPTALIGSQTASPSPHLVPSAASSLSVHPIQQTFASARVLKGSEDGAIETESKTPANDAIVLNSSPSKASSSLSKVEAPSRPVVDARQQATASVPVEESSAIVLKDSGASEHAETGAELLAANPPIDTPVVDASKNGAADANWPQTSVDQGNAQAGQSLTAPENIASTISGSSAEPAANESGPAIAAGLALSARATVPLTVPTISTPEDIAKQLTPISVAAPQIHATVRPTTDPATSPATTGNDQRPTTVLAMVQAEIETSLAAPIENGISAGSMRPSMAGATAENGNGNQVLQSPVKNESPIAGATANPAFAGAADAETRQPAEALTGTGDRSSHATQNDLPSSQSPSADPSHAAQGVPKASDSGPVQPSSAQAQAVVPQPAIPETARADRTAVSSDAVPLAAERHEIPASIHGDGGEAPATSSINTAKLMQTMSASEMHIGMNSTEFGEISIRTSIAQQQMVAQISLDHSGLSQAISAHVSTMQAKLGEDLGFNASIEVHNLGSSFSGEQNQSPQREQKSFAGSAPGGSATSSHAEETSMSLVAQAAPGSEDRLDIRA